MSEDYWDGATWVLHGTIATDASTAGTVKAVISPGAGNDLEILYGFIEHTDASSRTCTVYIRDDGARTLSRLVQEAFASSRRMFPQQGTDAAEARGTLRLIMSGLMDLLIQVASMSVSDTFTFAVVVRTRGGMPTATLSGPSGATLTTNTKKVF